MKAATILGLGRESLVSVAVNENSRMDPIGWYSFCLSSFSPPNVFFFLNNEQQQKQKTETEQITVGFI